MKRKPDYRAINRQKEERMAAEANRTGAWRRHCEITDAEVETGRAYEAAAIAAAEREAARRAKC
jgi:hypothetical protein